MRWLLPILTATFASAQNSTFDVQILEKLLAAPDEAGARTVLDSNPSAATSALAAELDRRGIAASAKNDLTAAMRIDRLAILVADRAGDARLQSKSRGNLGIALYRSGSAKEALDTEREALIFSAKAGADDLAASEWLSACSALVRLGELQQAEEDCIKSIDLNVRIHDRVAEARGHNELAQVYKAGSKFRPALEQYQASLKLAEAENQQMGIAFVSNNIGSLLVDEGEYEAALPYFERSLKIKRANGTPADEVSTVSNIAETHRRMGHLQQAARAFEEVLALCDKAALPNNCRGLNLNNLAMLEAEQRNYALAAEHLREAAELITPPALGGILVNLGKVLTANGQSQEALEPARKGLEIAQKMGAREDERRGWYVMGRIARARGDLDEAEADFSRSVEVLEAIRADVAGDAATLEKFFEEASDPYLSLIDVLVEQRKTDAAFQASERAKARVLVDALSSGGSRPSNGLTPEEQRKEAQLHTDISRLNGRLLAERAKAQDPKRIAQLASDLDRARAEYSGFETILYAEHPELRLDRVEVAPPAAADAAALFARKRLDVIEFSVGQEAVYAFVFSSRDAKVHFFRVAANKEDLSKKCARFAAALASRDLGFGALARQMYALLIQPAEPWLRPDSTLGIVPDGALWQIPFQALEPAENHYLIEKYAVFYSPSTTVLAESIRRSGARTAHPPKLLALGNPAAAGQAPLPSAESEVAAIAAIYGGSNSRVLTGARATEAVFKENASRFDIIHLAAHGFLNSTNPMYSNILLAPGPPGEDGFLEAREILKLNLSGEIVVLSACETAGGRFGQGEGLIGMSWAFFVAGSRSTIASQWKVDSASTTALMTDFHRELHDKLARASARDPFVKSQALRHAMIDMLSKPGFSHPFYWAAFVMLGDGF